MGLYSRSTNTRMRIVFLKEKVPINNVSISAQKQREEFKRIFIDYLASRFKFNKEILMK